MMSTVARAYLLDLVEPVLIVLRPSNLAISGCYGLSFLVNIHEYVAMAGSCHVLEIQYTSGLLLDSHGNASGHSSGCWL